MTGLDFSIWLALIACIIGGVRVGRLLGDPAPEAGDAAAMQAAQAAPDERRTIAVAVLAAHIGSAAVLGYGAALGHGMVLALGLGWIAAAAMRLWAARKLGQLAQGAVVELLIGLVLALPAWSDMARLARGSIV